MLVNSHSRLFVPVFLNLYSGLCIESKSDTLSSCAVERITWKVILCGVVVIKFHIYIALK